MAVVFRYIHPVVDYYLLGVGVDMKYTYYAPYYGLEHLMLLKKGWRELHCLFVDGEVFIKLVSP